MRQLATIACAAALGLAVLAPRADALAVVDVYSYIELRRNPDGALDPRLPMFIDLKDVDGDITSATVAISGPSAFSGQTFPLLNFGPFLAFEASEPVLDYGRIWRTPNDDVTEYARATFTMSITDNSQTVTGKTNPLIGPSDTAEYLPLVSNVSTSGNPLAPTVSWTNPTDMSGIDRIRVRVVETDGVTFFTEVYSTVITDLTTTSTTIPEGFLFAGDFQLRVQLEDTESVTDTLDGVSKTSVRPVNRSMHVSDLKVVPLPGSVYMMLSALAGLAWFGRRRLRAAR